jgi:hypothetical protein
LIFAFAKSVKIERTCSERIEVLWVFDRVLDIVGILPQPAPSSQHLEKVGIVERERSTWKWQRPSVRAVGDLWK